MKKEIATLVDRKTDEEKLKSSYRRLVTARLPVNLYSARGAHMQRRAAMSLHGMDAESIQWEELDCIHLADDERGDRTSLLLGGAIGGVALTNFSHAGLLATAGTGTLFLSNLEKLSPAAQRVLCRIMETGHYTPVGDPFPRPVCCRLMIGTHRPLSELARRMLIGGELVRLLGGVSLRAEDVLNVLEKKETYRIHPSTLAAAS
jgi:transcriptional regulator of aromatic amino acid metabolism